MTPAGELPRPAGGAGAQGRGRPEPRPDLRSVLLAAIAVILVGAAVRSLAVVLVPLATAVLTALAVMPVRDRVSAAVPERLGWLGPVAALGVVLVVLGALVGVVVLAARQVVADLPVSAGQVVEAIQQAGAGGEDAAAEGAQAGAGGALAEPAVGQGSGQASGPAAPPNPGPATRAVDGQGAGAQEAGGQEADGEGGSALSGSTLRTLRTLGERALGAAGGAAAALLNSALGLLGGLVLIVFLTLLILTESGDWRRKAAAALPWPGDWRLSESAEVIAEKMRAYLWTQATIGAASAALYAVWLGAWGIGLLVVWPLLIFVLNFIPTIGSLVGGTLPIAYALITRDVGTAVAVGAGILVIENVMGNLVTPRVQGRSIALSPLVVLVSLVFWAWAWGVAGALLAVPMTVALVVVGAHVPILRPWALMLSNKTGWAGLDEATRPHEEA